MTIIPVGEWLPDLPALNNPGCPALVNALPTSQAAYGPFPGFGAVLSPPLPTTCAGLIGTLDSAAHPKVFAATTANLFMTPSGGQTQFNSQGAWQDLTPSAGIVPPPAGSPIWRFAQYLNTLIAFQTNNHTLSLALDNLTPTSRWADLNTYDPVGNTGAPSAFYGAVTQSGFVILGHVGWPPANTGSSTVQYRNRIWWSGIGAPSLWPTPGSAAAVAVQSGFVEIPSDMGDITGLVPNVSGIDCLVFLRKGIVRVIYIGGLAVFQVQPVLGTEGTPQPTSIVKVENTVYYRGERGFYSFDGANLGRIGAGKVDNWFTAKFDPTQKLIGVFDHKNRGIRWLFGINAPYDTQIFYSIPFQRWGMGSLPVTFGGQGLDSNSLASAWLFDNANVPHEPNGLPLSMSFSSAERRLFPARRSFVTGIKPLIDGGKPTISMLWRQNETDAQTMNAPTAQDAAGLCPQRVDAHFTQATMATDGVTNWSQVLGFDVPDEYVVPSGSR